MAKRKFMFMQVLFVCFVHIMGLFKTNAKFYSWWRDGLVARRPDTDSLQFIRDFHQTQMTFRQRPVR